jgi:triacylglycerol esterase/lipase EstA (alpha/beta hydrolase family)
MVSLPDPLDVSLDDRLLEANESPRVDGTEIAAALEGVDDNRGCPVDILGHSMGGLGSR